MFTKPFMGLGFGFLGFFALEGSLQAQPNQPTTTITADGGVGVTPTVTDPQPTPPNNTTVDGGVGTTPTASVPQNANPETPPRPPPPTPAQLRGRYALPWVMRPAIAPILFRQESSIAAQNASLTNTMLFTGGSNFKSLRPDLGIYGRFGVIFEAPNTGTGGVAVSNPLIFMLYTPAVARVLRIPVFFGITLPIGSGGGNTPVASERSTVAAGVYSRQAMDNALFATNYLTITGGVGLAWVDKGATVQLDLTVLQLFRVRGEAVDSDATRTNFTSGLSVGYQIVQPLTVSVEAHYQHWLSTPAAVAANEALRNQFTIGGGVRGNIPLSDTVLARPGIAFFAGLDAPMWDRGYKIVQLDLPIAF